TPSSQYDPALPGRPIGSWLTLIVGPQSGVSWRLGECVEQAGAANGADRDIPACVEATAILPDDRKIVAQFFVGSLKLGLSDKTMSHVAAMESDTQFQNVQKLSDLPKMLRAPFPTVLLKPVELREVKTLGRPRFFLAKAPALADPPRTLPIESGGAIPPPP